MLEEEGVSICPEEMGGDMQFQLRVQSPFSLALSSLDSSSYSDPPVFTLPWSATPPSPGLSSYWGRGAPGMGRSRDLELRSLGGSFLVGE